jgi:hypothetical protein
METLSNELAELHSEACANYRSGERVASKIVSEAGALALADLGIREQVIFDFAEDFVRHGEPSMEDFLSVVAIRQAHFVDSLGGCWPGAVVPESALPLRADEWEGIPWLPRIIRKAACFLEGSLPPDVMFGCGGDRGFLKGHGLKLAEFLTAVKDAKGDDAAILRRVRRS